jgi:hypothetical protein
LAFLYVFMTREHLVKNILVPIVGFGLAGALWGYEVFLGEVGEPNPLGTPFAYVLGSLFLGILGSGSLVLFSGNWKKILQMIGLGTLAWIVAFNLPRIWEYYLWLGGGLLLAAPFSLFGWITFVKEVLVDYFIKYTSLDSLQVANFWIEFFFAGAIVSAVYYFLLKSKPIRTILFGAFGFALASILSPIFGNVAGNIFDSLFVAYLATFSLIGIIFGASLVWGLKNKIHDG